MTTSTDLTAHDFTRSEYDRLRGIAIDALTQASQLVWPARTVTTAGVERHTMPHPVDTAELIVSVITSVAANAGGIDQLLAARPGSWEADLVRSIVQSSTGEDERLLAEHRTAPIDVRVSVYDLLAEAGVLEAWEQEKDSALNAIIHSVGPMAAHDGAVDDQLAEAEELFSRRRREAMTGYAKALTAEIQKAARDRGYDVPVNVTLTDFGHDGPGTLEVDLVREAAGRVDLPEL